MWLIDAIASIMPVMVAQHDSNGNMFDSKALRDYLVAWLETYATKED